MEYLLLRIISDTFGIAPAGWTDSIIGKPIIVCNIGRASTFVVQDCALFIQTIFKGCHHFFIPAGCLVVVVRQKVEERRLRNNMQVEILINDIGFIAVDNFLMLRQPVGLVFFLSLLAKKFLKVRIICMWHMFIIPGNVIRMVHGKHDFHILFTNCFREQSN